jgi:predicted outer membrane lipoprotein
LFFIAAAVTVMNATNLELRDEVEKTLRDAKSSRGAKKGED